MNSTVAYGGLRRRLGGLQWSHMRGLQMNWRGQNGEKCRFRPTNCYNAQMMEDSYSGLWKTIRKLRMGFRPMVPIWMSMTLTEYSTRSPHWCTTNTNTNTAPTYLRDSISFSSIRSLRSTTNATYRLHVRDWVTVPSPSLAQDFGTVCLPHYATNCFRCCFHKTVEDYSLVVRLRANFRLLLVLFSCILLL